MSAAGVDTGPAPFLLDDNAGSLPDAVMTVDAPSMDFGLKKPFRDFWPDDDVPDGVDMDLERLAVMAGAGWLRLRGEFFESCLPTETLGWLGVSLGVGVADGVVVFRVGVDFSCALATEVVRERVLGGLQANISLMLRRLSTSNSGRRRPEVGSKHRDEYSCCRSPSLNIPGGFMMSRI